MDFQITPCKNGRKPFGGVYSGHSKKYVSTIRGPLHVQQQRAATRRALKRKVPSLTEEEKQKLAVEHENRRVVFLQNRMANLLERQLACEAAAARLAAKQAARTAAAAAPATIDAMVADAVAGAADVYADYAAPAAPAAAYADDAAAAASDHAADAFGLPILSEY